MLTIQKNARLSCGNNSQLRRKNVIADLSLWMNKVAALKSKINNLDPNFTSCSEIITYICVLHTAWINGYLPLCRSALYGIYHSLKKYGVICRHIGKAGTASCVPQGSDIQLLIETIRPINATTLHALTVKFPNNISSLAIAKWLNTAYCLPDKVIMELEAHRGTFQLDPTMADSAVWNTFDPTKIFSTDDQRAAEEKDNNDTSEVEDIPKSNYTGDGKIDAMKDDNEDYDDQNYGGDGDDDDHDDSASDQNYGGGSGGGDGNNHDDFADDDKDNNEEKSIAVSRKSVSVCSQAAKKRNIQTVECVAPEKIYILCPFPTCNMVKALPTELHGLCTLSSKNYVCSFHSPSIQLRRVSCWRKMRSHCISEHHYDENQFPPLLRRQNKSWDHTTKPGGKRNWNAYKNPKNLRP